MGKQDNAPFKFLVRPLTTVHVRSKNLSRAFEEEVFASFVNVEFSPPISGILILPIIVDDGKRDFPRTLTPAVLMGCPSIGRYRAVQAVAALWKLKGSRSVISASPAR
jgi:hypothetical protein